MKDGFKFLLVCAGFGKKDAEIAKIMDVSNGTFYNYKQLDVFSEKIWANVERAFPNLRNLTVDEYFNMDNSPKTKTSPSAVANEDVKLSEKSDYIISLLEDIKGEQEVIKASLVPTEKALVRLDEKKLWGILEGLPPERIVELSKLLKDAGIRASVEPDFYKDEGQENKQASQRSLAKKKQV